MDRRKEEQAERGRRSRSKSHERSRSNSADVAVRDRRAFSDVGLMTGGDRSEAGLLCPPEPPRRRFSAGPVPGCQIYGPSEGCQIAGALATSALSIMVTPPTQQQAHLSSSTSVPSGLMNGGHQMVTPPITATRTDTDESDSPPRLRSSQRRQRCDLPRSPQFVGPDIDNDLLQATPISPDNRHALRNLSRSTPTMNRLESQTSFEVPRSQRKFLRRFKDLDAHEKIIKSFSCALVSDILLQGRLYVTSHHFAFYSNLFGHVTRILIPCSLVLDITKERTARIIPNAVAILSSEGRHVFGSLLSRDSAFETLVRVWRKEIGHDEADACGNDKEDGLDDDVPLLPSVGVDVSDSTATEENDSALDFTASPAATIELTPGGASVRLESVPVRSVAPPAPSPSAGGGLSSLFAWLSGNSTAHRSTLLLLFCNLLLLLIFCSSYASLSRMEEIQRRIESPYQRVETQESLEEAERTLNLHLQQLAMVRKSLESLSSLTMSGHPGGDST
ncbi:GRAM domain-containing protein 2B-like isoform X2 [Amphibalanus amphitrite]|uniref:GRAM domain-containing protein 2B-like isoform X2 n=2 Tax=Amphibalanus amphitrite TaxID=1232801 RepID=UPI001C925F12|nr:GRAM domain-containing protein 2B-like isoform X2 [Amphibalanus amphitrite]